MESPFRDFEEHIERLKKENKKLQKLLDNNEKKCKKARKKLKDWRNELKEEIRIKESIRDIVPDSEPAYIDKKRIDKILDNLDDMEFDL